MYKIMNMNPELMVKVLTNKSPFYGDKLLLKHFFVSIDDCEVAIDEPLFNNVILGANLFDQLSIWLKEHNLYPSINHSYRTMVTQKRLLAEGLAGENSLHLYGSAYDITLRDVKYNGILMKSKLLAIGRDIFKELLWTREVVIYQNFIHITFDSDISKKINPKREFIISKTFNK